jgi:hypothetical protein
METTIEQKAQIVIDQLKITSKLYQFVDSNLSIPKVFRGTGEIRLIFLGQDPTVKNQKSRNNIKFVLNLDKTGSLTNYLNKICKGLGLELEKNIYATNYFKNFFVLPPTQIKENELFNDFARLWLPLLQEELKPFGNIPIITLGQPVLELIVQGDVPKLVREYWGYNSKWKSGKTLPFKCITPSYTILNRRVFPFPHQPSISKRFYRDRLSDYVNFMHGYIS